MRRLLFIVCLFRDHRFDGWPAQRGYRPGAPLPMAHCGRCGREF